MQKSLSSHTIRQVHRMQDINITWRGSLIGH